LPPPPFETSCSKVCLYVSSPLSDSAPWLVHPTPHLHPYDPIFKQFYYNASLDYALPANTYPNGFYRDDTHPSQKVVAHDTITGDDVYVDSVLPVLSSYHSNHNLTSSGYSKSVLAGEGLPRLIDLVGLGHQWGYSTCHWIRSCTNLQKVGSPCTATLAGVAYSGYCFESSLGSLQCGHTVALDSSLGNKPLVIGQSRSPYKLVSEEGLFASTASSTTILPQASYRCERGSTAVAAGSYVGKRLPIAGCMVTSDALYDAMADVHVPAYCATPQGFRMGCMVPGAINFDPSALQPSQCHYVTRGCISTTAVNYNPEASIDDGSCIEKVEGCTIAPTPYAGVDSNTPSFRSGFYGSALADVGKVAETVYGGVAVTNFEAGANVLSGCIVAVEGCMDNLAANYDPNATINSATWCIPRVVGCMMPNVAHAPASFAPTSTTNTAAASAIAAAIAGSLKDGLAGNFNPAASVHDPALCTIERHGCMDSTMNNYDALATVAGACYPKLEGCLNPAAKNLYCTSRQYTACPELAGVTQLHARAICQFDDAPPMPPGAPPPPLPPGQSFERKPVVATTMVAGGDVADYDETVKGNLKSFFAEQAGTNAEAVEVDVTGASVNLEILVTFADLAAANSAAEQISAALGDSAASASAALGITVQSAPSTTAKEILVMVVTPPASTPLGLIIGLASGGGALAIVIVLMIWRRQKNKKRLTTYPVEPAYDEPLENTRKPKKQAWADNGE